MADTGIAPRSLPFLPEIVLGAAALALAFLLSRHAQAGAAAPAGRLTVFCAAGLKPAVEAIAAQYGAESRVEIDLRYGGSGELLSSIAMAHVGDVFIAADSKYLDDAEAKGLGAERFALAEQEPVLAVRSGNPKRITGIADVDRADVRFGLANPETAAIGRLAKRALSERKLWDDFAAHCAVMKPTVTDVATDLSLGSIDAAILWTATIPRYQGIERVPEPILDATRNAIEASVLTDSPQPTAALAFCRYLAAPDRGGTVFAKYSYTPAPGDAWSAHPAFTIFSGSVNRAAIDQLVGQFQAREGAAITTVYNGCGILCASMKALAQTPGAHAPDAYYACDICFVPPVEKLYPEAVLLTETPIVIAVAKGNPKGVHSLVDLAQPGMRVGISNAEQSSLGFITKRMLTRMNLWDGIERNSSAQEPTADLLIAQLKVGSLDAAIVYSTTVQLAGDGVAAIAIRDPAAKAVQPFSILKDSPNREMAKRLLTYLQAHRSVFQDVGFQWRSEQRPVESASLPPIGGDLDSTSAHVQFAPAK